MSDDANLILLTLATQKLLGPTFDYVGGGLRNLAAKCRDNLSRILASANKRLGTKAEEPGSIPPRVIGTLLTDGAFCDDELAAEYFGGVLASARSDRPRDDRGSAMMQLIRRLSTYQIRAHYQFYEMFQRTYADIKPNIGAQEARNAMATFIPMESVVTAMEFTESEIQILSALLRDIIWGLVAEGLLDDQFQYGSAAALEKFAGPSTSGGCIVRPTARGADLFLWAHGVPDADSIFETSAGYFMPVAVNTISNAEPISSRKKNR